MHKIQNISNTVTQKWNSWITSLLMVLRKPHRSTHVHEMTAIVMRKKEFWIKENNLILHTGDNANTECLLQTSNYIKRENINGGTSLLVLYCFSTIGHFWRAPKFSKLIVADGIREESWAFIDWKRRTSQEQILWGRITFFNLGRWGTSSATMSNESVANWRMAKNSSGAHNSPIRCNSNHLVSRSDL